MSGSARGRTPQTVQRQEGMIARRRTGDEERPTSPRYENAVVATLQRLMANPVGALGLAILAAAVVIALVGPALAPYDPTQANLPERLQGSSERHLLGTDGLGRDILSRLLAGARVALQVGALSVGIGGTAGLVLGLIAGFYGHVIDNVLMAIADVLLAFPGLLLALLIVTALGPDLTHAIIAVGIGKIPQFTRLVRGTVLSVREQDYVLAARSVGARDVRLIIRHVLVNSLAPFIVLASLSFGTAIVSAATLSFLGLGAQPPTPEWGSMLNEGRAYMRAAPWVATLPGLAILITAMGCNLLGDGLRDALDPRLRRR